MQKISVTVAPLAMSLLLSFAGGAGADEPAKPAEAVLTVPESLKAEGVPAIPSARAEDLVPYENMRNARLADWHPTERRMLIQTRFGESTQIHEVATPLGTRSQLTFYRDTVYDGLYRPGQPHQFVYALDPGGAENFQLFLFDRKTGRPRRFTDGTHRFVTPIWSRSGKWLAYSANVRNGRDMDLYVIDPSTPGSERRLFEAQGSWDSLEWSPDDSKLLVTELISANESYLHWVDVKTGEVHAITPRNARKEDPTTSYLGGVWSADGKSVFATTDKDSEFMRAVRIDVATGRSTVLSADIPWDVEELGVSSDGRLLGFFTNEDGLSKLHMLDLASGKEMPVPDLPAGIVGRLLFRPGSHEIGFELDWARSPKDVYSYDPDKRHLERWTASEVGGLDTGNLVLPELVRYPTFDTVSPGGPRRTIPAFVYRPQPDRFPGRRPVYIYIHGGPEQQSRAGFLGSTNYFPEELGVAVILPNVRGSAGYGKSSLKLDDGKLRENAVKDIGALLDWIAKQPDLDHQRVMVSGGSYGGYVALAALTFYSDRLCCGWDSVGISNFVTFLENTQGYRQDLRRVEYGDERDPDMRAFLEGIAPVRHAKKITKPLLVTQGENDPRVPVSESDQIVAAVQGNGVPVWYLVGRDEGHGFKKKANADYQRAVMFEFVRTFLLKP